MKLPCAKDNWKEMQMMTKLKRDFIEFGFWNQIYKMIWININKYTEKMRACRRKEAGAVGLPLQAFWTSGLRYFDKFSNHLSHLQLPKRLSTCIPHANSLLNAKFYFQFTGLTCVKDCSENPFLWGTNKKDWSAKPDPTKGRVTPKKLIQRNIPK